MAATPHTSSVKPTGPYYNECPPGYKYVAPTNGGYAEYYGSCVPVKFTAHFKNVKIAGWKQGRPNFNGEITSSIALKKVSFILPTRTWAKVTVTKTIHERVRVRRHHRYVRHHHRYVYRHITRHIRVHKRELINTHYTWVKSKIKQLVKLGAAKGRTGIKYSFKISHNKLTLTLNTAQKPIFFKSAAGAVKGTKQDKGIEKFKLQGQVTSANNKTKTLTVTK